jgi:hypothetical protein
MGAQQECESERINKNENRNLIFYYEWEYYCSVMGSPIQDGTLLLINIQHYSSV